jgi:uncharacterized protein with HEPN domain
MIIKSDLAYVEHILDCIRKIKEFSANLTLKEFRKNELVQDAIIRNIEIIGEASKKISPDIKKTYYNIPWKEIAGMRDKLIHDYIGVDVDVVWKTIKKDIPALEKLISEIKK